MFSSNARLQNGYTEIINLANGSSDSEHCNKCGDEAFRIARSKIIQIESETRKSIDIEISSIPIVSIQPVADWDCKVVGLVTAQSVTGTGVFSDVTSAFTDLFGAQSSAYNQKIAAGEEICKAALRYNAIEQGANAVVAADVDYAEVGGQRAMLMVCMTGTAVRINNSSAFEGLRILDPVDTMKRIASYRRLADIVKKNYV